MNNHPHPVDVYVGKRVRAARRSRGVSQQALAKRLGISYQQVQKYETATNRVSLSMLFEIAAALKVSYAYFFTHMPDPTDAATMLLTPEQLTSGINNRMLTESEL